jgi:anti-sigma-K factor RskA
MTMEPDPFRESTALYVLGALPIDERRAFEAHLPTCADCTAELRALRSVAAALPHSVMQTEPPAELRRRMLDAATDARRPVVPVRLDPAVGAVSLERERVPATVWVGWLAAAASVALAVGVSVYAMSLRTRLRDVEVRLADAVVRLQDSQQQLQVAVRETGSVRANLALLTAPDVVELRLAGQAPAPNARARAFLSRSRGLLFAATNLPAISNDRTYQLWYLTPGAPVSAGLLRPDSEGNATIAFEVNASTSLATGLALSLEPQGGVPAPTGAIYLVSQ